MAYTLGEATKATGISKTTLHRAIKSGKISATKNTEGSYEIDPAELHRVFPPAKQWNSSENPIMGQYGTDKTPPETAALRHELELLREERERERGQLEKRIDDLTKQLDQSDQERRDKDRQLTALLTDQRPRTQSTLEGSGEAAGNLPAEESRKPRRRLWEFLRRL